MMEWLEQYKTQSDSRFPTFKKAFELLHERKGSVIVETGCLRLPNDWGAGMSTFLFGNYCKNYGGHAYTVDISQTNMNVCIQETRDFSSFIDYTVADSLLYLSLFNKHIDLLYLDSVDCPVEVHSEAEQKELEFAQNHQLSEITIALPKVEGGIVLLDDNGFSHGGKTKLTKEYLKEKGWKEIMDGQQSLWVQ